MRKITSIGLFQTGSNYCLKRLKTILRWIFLICTRKIWLKSVFRGFRGTGMIKGSSRRWRSMERLWTLRSVISLQFLRNQLKNLPNFTTFSQRYRLWVRQNANWWEKFRSRWISFYWRLLEKSTRHMDMWFTTRMSQLSPLSKCLMDRRYRGTKFVYSKKATGILMTLFMESSGLWARMLYQFSLVAKTLIATLLGQLNKASTMTSHKLLKPSTKDWL